MIESAIRDSRALTKPEPISATEFAERRSRAAAEASNRELDGLLVWSMGGSTLDSFGDVFYLTNHYCTETKAPNLAPNWTGFGHAAVVLPVDEEPVLLVGPPNWRRDLVHVDHVQSARDIYELVARCIQEKGLAQGRIGISRFELFPLPLYLALRSSFPKLQIEPADDLLEQLRISKSAAEIALMQHSQAVSVEIMNAMMEEVAVGRTDGDLAAVGFRLACELGATPYEFAMASGPHADHAYYPRLPAFDPYRPYAKGDVVHPDVYGCVDGYFYDFVRSTVVGDEPTAAQMTVLEGAIGAVRHVCEQLRPGVRASDAYHRGREWMIKNGWDRQIRGDTETDFSTFDAFGHGIGLGWEGPWIVSNDDTVLRPGMTIAIETSVTDGDSTALYEETVLVTDGDPVIMTDACNARPWTST